MKLTLILLAEYLYRNLFDLLLMFLSGFWFGFISAMKKYKAIPIVLLGLSLSSGVWACESFEECLNKTTWTDERGWQDLDQDEIQNNKLKAIAFKLDEISKKLDKQTTEAGK